MKEQTNMSRSGGRPPAVFNADELLDHDRMRHGPMVVFWNQDEWIEPDRALPEPVPSEWPRRSPLQLILRHRRFLIEMRIAPPEGQDLNTWAGAVARKLGMGIDAELRDGDRALWLTACSWAPQAGGAIGGAGRVLSRLPKTQISQAAIRVREIR